MSNPFETAATLLHRASGPAGAPVILYLPGTHGDWTLLWRVRELLDRDYRLIEVAYPFASAGWSLEDYAGHVLKLMDELELPAVHVLGESFGSLPGWTLACGHPERVRSLMLAGGLCRTPGRVRVALAELINRVMPQKWAERMMDRLMPARLGCPRELAADPAEFFPAARSRGGQLAIRQRLRLIRQSDLRPQLCRLSVPVFYFGGVWDVVVPVRREIAAIRRLLAPGTPFEARLLPRGSHAVIPTRPEESAALIAGWVARCEGERAAGAG